MTRPIDVGMPDVIPPILSCDPRFFAVDASYFIDQIPFSFSCSLKLQLQPALLNASFSTCSSSFTID